MTVVDRTNHHLFTPLLYQVATAGLSAPAIAATDAPHPRGPGQHARCCWPRSPASIRAAKQVRPRRRQRARLRLPRRRGRRDPQLLRPRRVGAVRAGPEDARRRARDPPAHPARLRAAERETDPAERAAWLTFVVIGGGADRRRAGRHARRDRAPHAARRVPAHRPAQRAHRAGRGRRARAAAATRRTSRRRRSSSSSASASRCGSERASPAWTPTA